jgi:hypothetical protein
MNTDWLAVARNIAECARAKAARDQEKLEGILKRIDQEPAEQLAAAAR